MAKGRKECRGKWRNGSAKRVGTCWATACKTRDQQGPKLVASPSNRQGVRTPGACETRTCLIGNLACRSISALAGRLHALSWAGYVANMYHEYFSC